MGPKFPVSGVPDLQQTLRDIAIIHAKAGDADYHLSVMYAKQPAKYRKMKKNIVKIIDAIRELRTMIAIGGTDYMGKI
jgi:hypothetical protein